ncbi:fas-binding factor 1 isoform X1 [Python bivittatus]|uniref:Fas-binding factor 1 isoform X1 n=2 Tax=Python bivittatus TaxID=176946 RepID=A0A9F5J6I5_PYTBI|nr:fas-binding factor 1 isoform X1 [Python bivittatus]XP_025028323.1 fas-binding factor 1 isoform X1 [Python bivittatus]XP_025028324.1 fas-binding factor 1 isoform X1 [Python bivittatus]
MAAKRKKGLRSSIDDVLGDLLGDDDDAPIKSGKPASFGSTEGKARGTVPQANRRGLLEDDFFSKMAVEEGSDVEDPDISDVDPEALLETLKDMDEMEADILGIKKTSARSPQKPVKGKGTAEPLAEPAKSAKTATITEKGDSVGEISKDLGSVPSTSKQQKRFSLEAIDDPLAGLLSDDEESTVKKTHSSITKNTPEISGTPNEKVHGCAVAPDQKREELTFEDDGEDLMDALGFGETSKAEVKSGRKSEEKEPRPARSRLDELLGLGTAKKLLERPSIGEPKEFKLDKKYQKQTDKEDALGDDFTFGAYQPTMASTPEGRQSRRQSVRFSSENLSELKTDQRSKASPSASTSPVRNKSGADWLGLKDEDSDLLPPSPLKEPSKSSARGNTLDMPPFPSEAKHPPFPTTQGPSRSKQVTEEVIQKNEPAEDDGDNWLNNVLSQKKSQAQEKMKKRPRSSDVQTHGDHPTSQHVTSTQGRHQSAAPTDKPARLEESESFIPWERSQQQCPPTFPSDSRKGTPFGDTTSRASAAFWQGPQETLKVPIHSQALISEPHLLSSPNNADYEKRMAGVQAQLRETLATYQAELLSAQTHLTELEVQVRRLELEKNQQKLLLESLQRRHQEDLELIENAHRNRVKVVEDSYRQREDRLRQENQELVAQYLSRCQSAEQAKSEMLAQHQRRLTELEQEKAKEIDRLQELQRMSILEMRKDHEEQLQRLKQLKTQEIDAVTSATSYTRSLNGIIDQMEKFSSNLNDLATKVEATHHTTHQGLEMGARQRDEQLRVLQDRLNRQQRDMEDERGRLQEVISKMEARLNEQTRLLEQERWRVTTEQAKVESLQHSLEEQRRVMTQQLTMEREELERAKNSLLEEQKAVMQKCAEERRKLAAEWSELHIQQRLSKERSEREVDRALQIDSQREGVIMSLAKEQADLKIKASELRSKEEQLVRDRELLEQEKQELRLEKERVNATALHIKQRADEINSMSKLSSQKYEEGEKALLEAKKVESEHQARLHTLQQQMERLRQQEEHLHQERLSLSHQRRQLEQLRMELPGNPLAFQNMPQVPLSGAPDKIISNVRYLPLPITVPPEVNPGNPRASQGLPRTEPADLYAKLVLHKITAERDHDFLEEEQFFLETLKRASYKTSFQSA